MAYTRTQVLNKIISDITTNGNKDITGAIMAQVLNYMVDRIYQANEVPVDKSSLGYSATNLDTIIDELIDNISSNVMSANDIRDALQTLTSQARLNKSAIFGGETALNRRAKGDLYSSEWRDIHMNNVSRGDFFIYLGDESGILNNGDWVVALKDNPTGFSWNDGINWETISHVNSLSKEEIAAKLNLITTLTKQVDSNRVRYDSSLTVLGKLNAIDSEISGMQKEISTLREIFLGDPPSDQFVLRDTFVNILQLSINRVPYQGIFSYSFSGTAAGYDFIWYFDTPNGDTIVKLNPALGFLFTRNDLLDFIVYDGGMS